MAVHLYSPWSTSICSAARITRYDDVIFTRDGAPGEPFLTVKRHTLAIPHSPHTVGGICHNEPSGHPKSHNHQPPHNIAAPTHGPNDLVSVRHMSDQNSGQLSLHGQRSLRTKVNCVTIYQGQVFSVPLSYKSTQTIPYPLSTSRVKLSVPTVGDRIKRMAYLESSATRAIMSGTESTSQRIKFNAFPSILQRETFLSSLIISLDRIDIK